ncbi:hypothetical protein BDN70DRAFT_870657 [Pholiota conissans]|uniref:UBC core domain-containing protein n=1 Tax=Pholiota conissans TaxID=109636 RepID=A0A9P5ZEY6_9AGAR|nr:hypothetical protein BDN70DRAFT_870657 [Pholiota conissans]
MSTSTQWSRRLLARLYQDLAELQHNPYPGVAVFTDDADLRKLCLVLTPPSGPWKDMALHFDVVLPEDWPISPPMVSNSVKGIDHPNLFSSYVCCDLLKRESYRLTGYTGGYTPALTLRGLFLQFLTFFSSTKVEQEDGGICEIGDHTFSRYVWERDIDHHLPPQHMNCLTGCKCGSSPLKQQPLSVVWNASPMAEEIIQTPKREYNIFGRETEQTAMKRKFIHSARHFLFKLEWPNPRRTSTLNLTSKWACPSCPYGSPELPHLRLSSPTSPIDTPPFETSALFNPPAECKIDILNDDCLLELADHLSTEEVVTLSHIYPRFNELVAHFHVLQRLDLTCFFLRLPLQDAILGIGVALDEDARSLSSDFDWLSMEAFDVYKVRSSIEKRNFQYFLPLSFNRLHFRKARAEVWKRLGFIDLGLRMAEMAVVQKTGKPSNRRTGPPLRQHHVIDVLYRMMNNIVVSLMKSCDDAMDKPDRSVRNQNQRLLHASEKAIISYCHIFHLIIQLCETTPQVLQDVNSKLRLFMTQDAARNKAQTPDIGELIVVIMLSHILPNLPSETQPRVAWDEISGKFLQEAITRNVRWVLKDAPELEILEKGVSDYRLLKTFQLSKTSLRLMMFQMTFLGLFTTTYASDLSRLDSNYGFPEKELPERMVKEIKGIYQIDSWPKFFAVVRWTKGTQLSKETFSQMLKDCVRESATRKYHNPTQNNQRLGRLRDKRRQVERNIQF